MTITKLIRRLSQRRALAARFARTLGGSPWDACRLFTQVMTLPRNGKKARRLHCTFEGRRFVSHFFSFRELAPFFEVFAAVDYEGNWQNCRTILDIGANIGAASLFFSIRSPESRIVAIEPDQANLQRLRLNLAQVPQARVVEKALSATGGRLTFYRNDGFNLGASLMEKRPGFIEDSVDSVTLDHLLENLDYETVDLCKFDVEGAEFDIFRSFSNTRRIRQFIGEYHEDLAHQPVAAFLNLFPHHRTEAVQIAPQRYVCRGVLDQGQQAA